MRASHVPADVESASLFDRWVVALCILTLGGWMLAAGLALLPMLGLSSGDLPRQAGFAMGAPGAAWALLLAVHGLTLGLVMAHLWRLDSLSRRRKLLWLAGLAGSGPVAMSLYWALHMRRLHRRDPARAWPHPEFMPSGPPVTQAE